MRAQEIVVTNCTEVDFRAAVNSNHVIRIVCDGTITLTSPLVIASTKVIDGTGHSVTLSGGNTTRLFEVIPGGDLTFSNLTITQGRVQGTNGIQTGLGPQPGQSVEGGGVVVSNASLKAFNCVFTSCSANGGNGASGMPSPTGAGAGGEAMGGGIFARGSFLVLSNCAFANNAANSGFSGSFTAQFSFRPANGLGGAIALLGSTASVFSCRFTNNVATINGGGIDASGASGLLTVLESVFVRNNAGFNGGAIDLNGGSMAVHRSTFATNTAVGIDARVGDSSGGALCVQAGSVQIAQCEFRSNASAGSLARPRPTFSPLSGGAGRGGAMALFGGTASVSRCVFWQNTAIGGDGISGAQGTGGAASGYGGALYTQVPTALTNCTFAMNQAQAGGSGGAELAAANGGGIATGGSQLILNSCTIASNRVSSAGSVAGGGINTVSSLVLNTILGFNSANGALQNAAGTNTDAGYNISSDATPAWTTANSFNNLAPMLLPLANNGGSTLTMALRANSPALNASNPATAPSVDQRGFLRPSGAGFDIGAYEGPGVPLLQILRENSSTNVVRAAAEPGRTYVLEHSIFVSGWTPVATNVAPPIGPVEFRVPSNLDARFFRLRAD